MTARAEADDPEAIRAAEAWNARGSAHFGANELEAAREAYTRALAVVPRFAKALANLGRVAFRSGDAHEAIRLLGEALEVNPGSARAHSSLAQILASVERRSEARVHYEACLRLEADYVPALRGLAQLVSADAAVPLLERAAKLAADAAIVLELGDARLACGDLTGARASYHAATAVRSIDAERLADAGERLDRVGDANGAREAFLRAIELDAKCVRAHVGVARVLGRTGRAEEAERYAARAIELAPRDRDARLAFAIARRRLAHFEEATAVLLALVDDEPDLAEAHANLVQTLGSLGRVEEALAHGRRAAELGADLALAMRSDELFSRHYRRLGGPRDLAERHAAWGRDVQFAAGNADFFVARAPRERFSIGYLSADFRNHAVAKFLVPLLEGHDRARVTVNCYSATVREDATTARIRALASRFTSVTGLSDEQLAARIRDDGIDVLVELGGHTGESRLAVLGRRVAPLQVSYLGYPDTTGLTTVDLRITDRYADPPGRDDALYTERLVRLPDTAWCFAPDASPDVHPGPALSNGSVTFGCFNNFAKVTPEREHAWAEILQRVPGAKLLLKAKSLAERDAGRATLRRFERRGIDPSRVQCIGWVSDPLAAYARIDVALDTAPYHGTTTTCEALWMGVPVVTQRGDSHVSRVGASLLHGVGLDTLVTDDTDAYIDAAVALARDATLRRTLRTDLRARVRAATLGQPARFARHFEDALFAAWNAVGPSHGERLEAPPRGVRFVASGERCVVAVDDADVDLADDLYVQGSTDDDATQAALARAAHDTAVTELATETAADALRVASRGTAIGRVSFQPTSEAAAARIALAARRSGVSLAREPVADTSPLPATRIVFAGSTPAASWSPSRFEPVPTVVVASASVVAQGFVRLAPVRMLGAFELRESVLGARVALCTPAHVAPLTARGWIVERSRVVAPPADARALLAARIAAFRETLAAPWDPRIEPGLAHWASAHDARRAPADRLASLHESVACFVAAAPSSLDAHLCAARVLVDLADPRAVPALLACEAALEAGSVPVRALPAVSDLDACAPWGGLADHALAGVLITLERYDHGAGANVRLARLRRFAELGYPSDGMSRALEVATYRRLRRHDPHG